MEEENDNFKNADASLLVAYYQHQYDRMAKFEEQSLTITNIVTSLSILVFTFAFDSDKLINGLNGVVLPCIIIACNFFAIGHTQRSRKWVRLHRARAKKFLEHYGNDLHILFKQVPESQNDQDDEKAQKEKERFLDPLFGNKFPWLGRRDMQNLLHLTIIFAATIPMIHYKSWHNLYAFVPLVILALFAWWQLWPQTKWFKREEKAVQPLSSREDTQKASDEN